MRKVKSKPRKKPALLLLLLVPCFCEGCPMNGPVTQKRSAKVPQGEELLFPEDVASWIGCSVRVVFDAVRNGELEAHQFGGRKTLRFDRDAVRKFIQCKRVEKKGAK